MFLANNKQFWQFRKKAHFEILRMNIYSSQRLYCEEKVYLFKI